MMRVVEILKGRGGPGWWAGGAEGKLANYSWYVQANRPCFLELEVRGTINYIKALITKTHLLVTKNVCLYRCMTIKE